MEAGKDQSLLGQSRIFDRDVDGLHIGWLLKLSYFSSSSASFA